MTLRIVFIGAVEFSRSALEFLISRKVDIVGICAMRRPTVNADHVDLSYLGERHGIPTHYADNINSAVSLSWIKERMPDVIFCFGWSRLLSQDLLELAPMGVIGFHPSALPANRGRHPLIWPLVLGLERTSSTFFFMDARADAGDILSQIEIAIDAEDDARTLYDKVTALALSQIEEFMPLLVARIFPRIKQDEIIASTWRKRHRTDGIIDWRMAARSIHNLVRGLGRPYLGAIFMHDGIEIKVWKTAVVKGAPDNMEPGRVWRLSISGVIVKCGEDAICLLETEPLFSAEAGEYL
jgi:methionyl-tRNA formyltransferase